MTSALNDTPPAAEAPYKTKREKRRQIGAQAVEPVVVTAQVGVPAVVPEQVVEPASLDGNQKAKRLRLEKEATRKRESRRRSLEQTNNERLASDSQQVAQGGAAEALDETQNVTLAAKKESREPLRVKKKKLEGVREMLNIREIRGRIDCLLEKQFVLTPSAVKPMHNGRRMRERQLKRRGLYYVVGSLIPQKSWTIKTDRTNYGPKSICVLKFTRHRLHCYFS